MSILIEYTGPLTTKLAAAFMSVEPQTIVWNPASHHSIYNLVDIHKPSLIIARPNEHLFRAIDRYKDCKVILWGLDRFPYINEQCLLRLCNKLHPDIAESLDVDYLEIEPMANVCQIINGKIKTKWQTDLLFIANCEKPPYLNRISPQYSLKIVGPYKIDNPCYLGRCSPQTEADLIVTSKITLDYNKNCLLDVAFNGGFALTNLDDEIYPKYNDENLSSFLKNKKERHKIAKEAQQYIRDKRLTTLDCIKNIFDKIGDREYKHKCEEVSNRIY